MPFIPHTEKDTQEMLAAIGAESIDDLFDEIPPELRIEHLHGVPEAHNEMEISRLMRERAAMDGSPLCFHRRRCLRAPYSGGRLGHCNARRVLQCLHAVPGRGEPGHAADHLRIPDDDHRADRARCQQRVAVRRCVGAGRGGTDGGAHQSRVQDRTGSARTRCESRLRAGGGGDCRQPGPDVSNACRWMPRTGNVAFDQLEQDQNRLPSSCNSRRFPARSRTSIA